MKKLLNLFLIGLFVFVAVQAFADEPIGDVGSTACGDVQIAAQAAVTDGMPYRNHGQMVRTAANVVSPYLEAEEITEECSSCIMNQFARRIPIDEQESCGVIGCVGKVCGEYTFDCNPDTDNCLCMKIDPDGDAGICANDFPCDSAPDCDDGACPEGRVCVYDTCCGGPKCAVNECTGIIVNTLNIESGGTASGN